MREIKFRAWDKKDNVMLKVQEIDFSQWWVQCCKPNGEMCITKNDRCKHGERNSFNNEDTDRFILMQYTGLKDKNGVEIYVGDILEMPDDELYFEVAFDKSDLRYCATEFVLRTNYDLSDFIVANDNREDVINGFVVGNIYENKNFLEE